MKWRFFATFVCVAFFKTLILVLVTRTRTFLRGSLVIPARLGYCVPVLAEVGGILRFQLECSRSLGFYRIGDIFVYFEAWRLFLLRTEVKCGVSVLTDV